MKLTFSPAAQADLMDIAIVIAQDSATRALTLTTIFDLSDRGGPVRRWVREDAMHLLSADDLRMYAEDAGLEVEVMAGDYDLSPIGPGDGRAVLVARRPAAP